MENVKNSWKAMRSKERMVKEALIQCSEELIYSIPTTYILYSRWYVRYKKPLPLWNLCSNGKDNKYLKKQLYFVKSTKKKITDLINWLSISSLKNENYFMYSSPFSNCLKFVFKLTIFPPICKFCICRFNELQVKSIQKKMIRCCWGVPQNQAYDGASTLNTYRSFFVIIL